MDLAALDEESRRTLLTALDMGLSGSTMMTIGDLLIEGGNLPDAARVYGVAYAEGIPEAEVRAFWALTQMVGTREGEAIMTSLVDRWPEFAFPKSALAVNFVEMGDGPAAEEMSLEAIRTQPRSPVAHFTMGLIYLSLEREFEARVQFQCVVRVLDTPSDLLEEARSTLRELGPPERDIELSPANGDLPGDLLGCALRTS